MMVRPLVARSFRAWTSVLALVMLVGCTGTSESVRPIVLVVAAEDRIGLVEDQGVGADDLRWLPAAEGVWPDADFVHLEVARAPGVGGEQYAYLVSREVEGDVLYVFDASAVDPEDPTELRLVERRDLQSLMSQSLLASERLCTRTFDISQNGRWLALLHAPSDCGSTAFDEGTLVVVDLEADAPEEDVHVIQDGDFASPSFTTTGDAALYFLNVFDDHVNRLDLPSLTPSTYEQRDIDESARLGFGGGGELVLANGDVVVLLDPVEEESIATQETEFAIEAVVDATSLRANSAVLRTSSRLVVHRDLVSADEDEDGYVYQSFGDIAAAIVGPDEFAYVLSSNQVEAVDLGSYLDGYEEDLAVTRVAEVPWAENLIGIGWVYGVFPE